MLTKEDLQAMQEMIDNSLDNKLEPIKNDIKEIKENIDELKENVDELKENVDEIRVSNNEVIEWLHIHYGDDKIKRFPVPDENDEYFTRLGKEVMAEIERKELEKKNKA